VTPPRGATFFVYISGVRVRHRWASRTRQLGTSDGATTPSTIIRALAAVAAPAEQAAQSPASKRKRAQAERPLLAVTLSRLFVEVSNAS